MGPTAGERPDQLVQATRDYAGTFNVTDYRWFNLRDSNSSDAAGSLPGAATTFATDGLLHDDYTPKPAFAAYRNAIATFGQLTAPAPAVGPCQPHPFRIGLRRERRPISRRYREIGCRLVRTRPA